MMKQLTGQIQIPPHNLEAEREVLGSVLLDNLVLLQTQAIITVADFYKEAHRIIYQTMCELLDKNNPIDLLTLPEAIRAKGELENIGGSAYLYGLIENLVTSAFTTHHAKIIKKQSIRRQLLQAAYNIQILADDESLTTEEALNQAEQNVFKIALKQTSNGHQGVYQGIDIIDRELFGDDAHRERAGIKTYFMDIDDKVGMLPNHSIIAVAGFTGEGKTALIDSIILRFIKETGRPVFKWSGEMSLEDCTLRYVCMEAKLDSTKVLAGKLSKEEIARYHFIKKAVADMPIIIDTTGAITVIEFKSKVRRLKLKYPDLGFVVIDNLPLMNHEGKSPPEGYRNTMVSLRAFVEEIGIPHFIATQYSYQIRKKENRMPQNDDIIYGSAVIQNSTHIWHIFNRKEDLPAMKRIRFGKQRYAPTGIITMTWLEQYTTFKDYIQGEGYD